MESTDGYYGGGVAVVERLKLMCGVSGVMAVVVLLLIVIRCCRCFVIVTVVDGEGGVVPANQVIFCTYSCTLSDGTGNCDHNGNMAGQPKLETNDVCILFSTPTNMKYLHIL